MGLSCLCEKTLKNHYRMELSWANNVYNTEFSVENRLEHGFAIDNTYFLWKWRFAHYFHYYSVISVFRPHIVQNRKLTLFSWGNFDQTTRISAKVRYKQVFFNETLLFSRNFPPTIVYVCLFTAMGLSFLSEKTLKNHDRMELSWANNVYNAEFRVENRLEHGFAIENTYFFWKWRFAHYFHYYSVISVFRPHIVQNRKLTLFSWGNFDQTTRISAKVRYKQVFSMKLSYFLEIFLQRSYMSVCSLQWA